MAGRLDWEWTDPGETERTYGLARRDRQLAACNDPPAPGLVALVQGPNQVQQNPFTAIKPTKLSALLREAQTGKLDEWVDFTDKMIDTDERLAGLIANRIDTVSQSRLVIRPGPHAADDGVLAQAGAEITHAGLKDVRNLDRSFGDLLHGIFIGLSGLEHRWRRREEDGRWNTIPRFVHGSLFRYGDQFRIEVLDVDRKWIALPPRKFVVHVPRDRSTYPTRTALLRSVAWLWLFKFWAWTFWVTGAERLGNPLMIAKVPRGSEDRVRRRALASLEQLSADQAAVLEENTGIEFPNVQYAQKAEVWENLIRTADAGIRLGLTGITGDEKGPSEVNEVRIAKGKKDGKRLSATVTTQWVDPFLDFNCHLTGGRRAPTPLMGFEFSDQVVQDPNMIAHAVNAGNVLKVDEFRSLLNTEPLGPEAGGEDFVGGQPQMSFTIEQAQAKRTARLKRRSLQLAIELG